MTKNLKKVISILLLSSLLISLMPLSVSAADVSRVSVDLFAPNGSDVAEGESFTIEVSVSSNMGFSALTLLVDFDDRAFELTEKQNGDLVPDEYFVPNASLDSGDATLAFQDFLALSDWTGVGTLARLTFSVRPGASIGDHYIRVTPVLNTALSVSGNSVMDVDANRASLYMSVTSAPASEASLDLYVSSVGSSDNDGLSVAAPLKYLDEAFSYVKENKDVLNGRDVVIHLSGRVYTNDPSQDNGISAIGDPALSNRFTITSTNLSLPGTLIHSYNYGNTGLTENGIILENDFTFRHIRFASYPVSDPQNSGKMNEERAFYCNGHDFTIGENCDFTNANNLPVSASDFVYDEYELYPVFFDDNEGSTDPSSTEYAFRYSVYGGGVDPDTDITDDYKVSVSSGTFYRIAPLMTYGGKISAKNVSCTVSGNTVVTERLYAGPCAAGDPAGNAFSHHLPLASNVDMTISGNCVIDTYIGGAGEFADKDMILTGNVVTTVKDDPTMNRYLGGGDLGTRTGSVTNIIRGGTFLDFFAGGAWGDTKAANNGTVGNITTTIFAGEFHNTIYGAGCYTPTVGNVELTVTGNGVNGLDNCTKLYNPNSDGGRALYGGSQKTGGTITGNITLTLSGCYLDASVYAAGAAPVHGNIYVNNYGALFKSGRSMWMGNTNTGSSVYGDVHYKQTGGTVPGSFGCSGFSTVAGGGNVFGNAYMDLSGGTIGSFKLNPSGTYQDKPLVGKLSGNSVLNVDISKKDVSINGMPAFDGLLIDHFTGGSGTLTVPGNKYVVVNHFSGSKATVKTGSFTNSGAFLTMPQEDVKKYVGGIKVLVANASINDAVSESGKEHIWYKSVPDNPIFGFTLLPDDKIAMRVIFDSNAPTSDGQYQYSVDGGNTFETVSYEKNGTFEGISGKAASFVIPAIEPTRFNDTILLRPNKSTAPVPYSIARACVDVVDTRSGGAFVYDDGFRDLAQSILNYGNCAREFFDYNVRSLASAEYAVQLESFDTWDDVTAAGNAVSDPVFVPVGISLTLVDSIRLNVWYQVDKNVDLSAFSVKVNGTDVSATLTRRDDTFCTIGIEVSGKDITAPYTVQVFKGNAASSNTLLSSVGSYCHMIRSILDNGQSLSDHDLALLELCGSISTMFHYRSAYFSI